MRAEQQGRNHLPGPALSRTTTHSALDAAQAAWLFSFPGATLQNTQKPNQNIGDF